MKTGPPATKVSPCLYLLALQCKLSLTNMRAISQIVVWAYLFIRNWRQADLARWKLVQHRLLFNHHFIKLFRTYISLLKPFRTYISFLKPLLLLSQLCWKLGLQITRLHVLFYSAAVCDLPFLHKSHMFTLLYNLVQVCFSASFKWGQPYIVLQVGRHHLLSQSNRLISYLYLVSSFIKTTWNQLKRIAMNIQLM